MRWMLEEEVIAMHLISLYGKCGDLAACRQIFGERKWTQIEVWNAIIAAFGRNARFKDAKALFEAMQSEDIGIVPDRRVYISMLSACTHCGAVDEAMALWTNHIANDEQLAADPFVVTAVIDCLAKSGRLETAKHILFQFDSKYTELAADHESMWLSVLSACRAHIHGQDAGDDNVRSIMQALWGEGCMEPPQSSSTEIRSNAYFQQTFQTSNFIFFQ